MTDLLQRVLKALSDGERRNSVELVNLLGTTSALSAMSRLKTDYGYNIHSEWSTRDGRCFKVYWIDKDNNGKEEIQ